MTLREKQSLFAFNLAKLIQKIFAEGYECTIGEVERPQWVAEIYQRQGIGSSRSVHCLRLAADIHLFKDGVYMDRTEDHAVFGEYWKSLDPYNRWGGDFGNKDGNHYSTMHNGRQ